MAGKEDLVPRLARVRNTAHPIRPSPAEGSPGDVSTIDAVKLKRLAITELADVLKRLKSIMNQARLEWGSKEKRFQAAEKAFLAWRLAVKATALLALATSIEPIPLLQEIRNAVQDKVQLSDEELNIHVTTSTAPRLARLLASSGRVHPDVRMVTQQLRQAKDGAYKLHAFFYEGDPGAAGFESLDELENTFKNTLQAADRASKTIAASVSRPLGRSRSRSREMLPA